MIWLGVFFVNSSSSHLHGTSIISCYSEIQVTAYPGCPGNWSLKCCVVVVIYVLPCCLIIVVDDGGIFKSRTRRAETRGATEIRDTRDTTTDLPLDCVRAEQVEVRTSPPRHGLSPPAEWILSDLSTIISPIVNTSIRIKCRNGEAEEILEILGCDHINAAYKFTITYILTDKTAKIAPQPHGLDKSYSIIFFSILMRGLRAQTVHSSVRVGGKRLQYSLSNCLYRTALRTASLYGHVYGDKIIICVMWCQ